MAVVRVTRQDGTLLGDFTIFIQWVGAESDADDYINEAKANVLEDRMATEEELSSLRFEVLPEP